MLPKPEKRQDNGNSKKGSTSIVTSSTVTTPLSIKKLTMDIKYPTEVVVLQNASFLARVAEPEDFSDSKIK